ncbi:ABC-three component system middle component 6 [Actinoallomurus sp. CA-150999]|uniref:ABC-three component system middle component 6 n=1 Tax=Actinoallomurus sp. CA-150999 TaxID=3239887 RepID=UPI003D8FB086
MLLPSKSIPADQALLAVGAQILVQLDQPGSVSAVWDRLQEWRSARGVESALPFWWFALALDVLFAIGVVDQRDGELMRKSRAA